MGKFARFGQALLLTAAAIAVTAGATYCAESTEDDQEIIDANLIKRIPAGYSFVEGLRGDLNGDSIDDYVIVIKANDPKKFEFYERIGKFVDRNRRGLMIFFKTGNDYKLVLENRQCFESDHEDGGGYFAPELWIHKIEKGNLRISYGHGRYSGWVFTFKYRHSDFELIGYDYDARNNCNDEREISINFLTKKLLIRRCPDKNSMEKCGTDCCCSNLSKETWSNIIVKEPRLLRKTVDFEELFVELDHLIYMNDK